MSTLVRIIFEVNYTAIYAEGHHLYLSGFGESRKVNVLAYKVEEAMEKAKKNLFEQNPDQWKDIDFHSINRIGYIDIE